MLQYLHIINAVGTSAANDGLQRAQNLTFETIRIAADNFGRGRVRVVSSHFQEDDLVVPPWISKGRFLERSLEDFGVFRPRLKLPLLADILGNVHAEDVDFVIFTNIDIGLMPYFYAFVDGICTNGGKAFTINRRTIASTPDDPARLPEIWAQAGEAHPGHDCFVFPAAWLPELVLGKVVVGMPGVGLLLLLNLLARTTDFRVISHVHATFHLGDDRTWLGDEYLAHRRHNALETIRGWEKIDRMYGPITLEDQYVRALRWFRSVADV